MEWYKFVRENKTWYEARKYCKDLGGKLFSNLNGTFSQLEFLSNKLGSCGWIGGEKLGGSHWRTADGKSIPSENIVWAEGEPRSPYMYICHEELYTAWFGEMLSVCDLIWSMVLNATKKLPNTISILHLYYNCFNL